MNTQLELKLIQWKQLAKITSLRQEGNLVIGEAVLLDNPKG